MGVVFDVIFLDHLDTDIEHLERLNQLLIHDQINQPGIEGAEKMRPLTTFIITPSVHLSDVAKQHQKDMPSLIHYFVSSLGRDATSCSDLLSYLLFTPKYTREPIELGYHDASERIDEIEDFLYASKEGDAEKPLASETEGNVLRAGSAAKRTGSSVRSRR
jgi:NTE family protein